MPKKIKGWKHLEHITDAFEEYKALKIYEGVYGKENVKLIVGSYFGNWYSDIYVKEVAERKAEVNSMFGSYVNFIDKKGNIYGDKILIKHKDEV